MRYELWLGLRYLFAKRRERVEWPSGPVAKWPSGFAASWRSQMMFGHFATLSLCH